MAKLFRPERIDIKNHPEINEKMIQDKIAEDPTIIGLGDLVLKDKERIQPRSGRLDLLMQDPDTNRRYEIEIQLGKTDENHIIRTIEYWDIEKKRYPQYDHCAVIIAEDITSRFLNVISLFNGFIPLIAIQMNAFKFGNEIGLVFTKVLDEMPLGLVEEDEEVQAVTNRDYWLNRGSEVTVKMADEILEIVNSFKPGFTLKYNKFYIGLAKNGQANNFAICRPKKNYMRLELKLPKSPEIDEIIEKAEIEEMGYDNRWGNYRLRLSKGDIKKHSDVLKDLLIKAEENFNG
jgi:predicted transport protein